MHDMSKNEVILLSDIEVAEKKLGSSRK